MEIEQTVSWGFGDGPMIIAGPCSAESQEQLLATAVALKAGGRTKLFRAGLWKPRSRPSSFGGEGHPDRDGEHHPQSLRSGPDDLDLRNGFSTMG